MVLDLVLIGLAITLDPLPLTAFLVVLPSERGECRLWSISECTGVYSTWVSRTGEPV